MKTDAGPLSASVSGLKLEFGYVQYVCVFRGDPRAHRLGELLLPPPAARA